MFSNNQTEVGYANFDVKGAKCHYVEKIRQETQLKSTFVTRLICCPWNRKNIVAWNSYYMSIFVSFKYNPRYVPVMYLNTNCYVKAI